jgi:hypothetical protein
MGRLPIENKINMVRVLPWVHPETPYGRETLLSSLPKNEKIS